MHLIISNIETDNIIIENKKDKIVLKYKINNFTLLGIPIKIYISNIYSFEYNCHLYINNIHSVNNLLNIEKKIGKNYKLLHYNFKKKEYYIVCRNKVNNISDNFVHISIVKIYNNNYYNYII